MRGLACPQVTNGAVLEVALRSLCYKLGAGESEMSTLSLNELVREVRRSLREELGFEVRESGAVGANPSLEDLTTSLEYLVAQLMAAQLVAWWEEEVRYHPLDLERICSTPDYRDHLQLARFEELVQAQTEHPVDIKLMTVRNLVQDALTLTGEEFARLCYDVHNHLGVLNDQTEDVALNPPSFQGRVVSATYKFVWLVMRLRLGQPDEAFGEDYEETRRRLGLNTLGDVFRRMTPIASSDLVEELLELHTVFDFARALWWAAAVRRLIIQGSQLALITVFKEGVSSYRREGRRLSSLAVVKEEFDQKTAGHLAQFLEFGWLNSPCLSSWGSAWQPDDRVNVVVVPYFRTVLTNR